MSNGMSDEDDEMWDDEDEPAGSNEQYDAVLQDIKDPSIYIGEGQRTIDASTDDEAKAKAREWARAECQKIGKKARLVVTGGTIYGSHSEEIDPASP